MTTLRHHLDFPSAKLADEQIDVGRLLGRLYSKKEFKGREQLVAGDVVYVGERYETPMLVGRTQPASAVPMFAAEGLDQLVAAASTRIGGSFDGVVVADQGGWVAAARLSGDELHTACTCGESYTCSTQMAALYSLLAVAELPGADTAMTRQLQDRLALLLSAEPADREIEDVLLACDAGYLALKDPAVKELAVHMQHAELGRQLSDELRELAIDTAEKLGPRDLATAVLGEWQAPPKRPLLAPIDVSTDDIIALAQSQGRSPAGLLLDDE